MTGLKVMKQWRTHIWLVKGPTSCRQVRSTCNRQAKHYSGWSFAGETWYCPKKNLKIGCSVHGVAGILGVLDIGTICKNPRCSGVDGLLLGNPDQLWIQASHWCHSCNGDSDNSTDNTVQQLIGIRVSEQQAARDYWAPDNPCLQNKFYSPVSRPSAQTASRYEEERGSLLSSAARIPRLPS